MPPKYPVREIMRRTMRNLEFIEQHATGKGPFDTTQLINSFLGAFVHVKEAYYNKIPTVPFPPPGWPNIQPMRGYFQPPDLQNFVRYVRNGISHGHIQLWGKPNGPIESIRIWNIPPRAATPDWKAEFSAGEMRQLLECFVTLMLPILRQYEA